MVKHGIVSILILLESALKDRIDCIEVFEEIGFNPYSAGKCPERCQGACYWNS